VPDVDERHDIPLKLELVKAAIERVKAAQGSLAFKSVEVEFAWQWRNVEVLVAELEKYRAYRDALAIEAQEDRTR